MTATQQHTVVPPWLRHATGTFQSAPTRGHHGTHQGDTRENLPKVRPWHALPADDLPRARSTPEPEASSPPWRRYTPTTHRHFPPTGAAAGPHRARDAATHRPADPRDMAARTPPTGSAPRAPGPGNRWASTPGRHATTPPWLQHSNPTRPARGDPGPRAARIRHGSRTKEHREDDQENARGSP